MQLQISRSIYEYWNSIRGDDPIPLRSALRPGPISGILPDLFILQWEDGEDMTFRLAGTRVCTMLGTELGRQPFASVWGECESGYMPELVRRIAESGRPVCLDIRGYRQDYPPLAFEMVLLPVLDGETGARRMLGSLAPVFASAWQLVEPVGDLRLEGIRALDGDHEDVEPEIAEEPASAPLLAGLWRRLVDWGAAPPARPELY
jgi:hypothetical protein